MFSIQPLFLIYRRSNSMYHHLGCTSIYRSLSYTWWKATVTKLYLLKLLIHNIISTQEDDILCYIILHGNRTPIVRWLNIINNCSLQAFSNTHVLPPDSPLETKASVISTIFFRYVCLSVCPSVRLFVCISVCPYICNR